MIKTTPHILSEEQDKRETIMCIVYASVIVLGMLALLLHGLAFFSWTEPTMEDLYARKRMENRITTLENHVHVFELRDYKHRYYDGNIKQEMAK